MDKPNKPNYIDWEKIERLANARWGKNGNRGVSELLHQARVSTSSYYLWRKGSKSPKVVSLHPIAKVLGMSMGELFVEGNYPPMQAMPKFDLAA